MPVRSEDIGKALCKSWGLDPDKVTLIEISIKPMEYARVIVQMLPDELGLKDLHEYNLEVKK